jgi:hypothetical protein
MGVLWGVSFDSVPISGVVVEFIKTAKVFRNYGYQVHLDLGYEVRADKDSFFRPYGDESRLLPDWVQLARIDGITQIPGYDSGFVADVLREVVQRGAGEHLLPEVDVIAKALGHCIAGTWQRLGVSVVVVENGTLPENITFTKALYRAIEEYGTCNRLGRFVLWRDHDLMWQSEPGVRKYGESPYPATVQPAGSPFIHYAALHEQARQATKSWAPQLTNIEVLPNTFTFAGDTTGQDSPDFRRHFGIPLHVPLIARSTRIIPQKRIDRDIHLVAALVDRCDAYLFVAGDPTEDCAEYAKLSGLP